MLISVAHQGDLSSDSILAACCIGAANLGHRFAAHCQRGELLNALLAGKK
jgi:hypothetical protein